MELWDIDKIDLGTLFAIPEDKNIDVYGDILETSTYSYFISPKIFTLHHLYALAVILLNQTQFLYSNYKIPNYCNPTNPTRKTKQAYLCESEYIIIEEEQTLCQIQLIRRERPYDIQIYSPYKIDSSKD